MKPNITPVTLISEKDKARIMNTLFKVKLLALVSRVVDLLRWIYFSGNYRSNYSSVFLFVAGSEIPYNEAFLLNPKDRVFWKNWKCSRKMPISVSCSSNVTLWLYQNRTLPWIFFEECSYFFWNIYLFSEPPNNHCFDKAPQGQLSLCNRRDTVIPLRTPGKSHGAESCLQDAELFAKSCSA